MKRTVSSSHFILNTNKQKKQADFNLKRKKYKVQSESATVTSGLTAALRADLQAPPSGLQPVYPISHCSQ